MPTRPIRVLQSFKRPRATTNPYIVMLDRALATEPTVDHVTFSWRAALTRPLDAVHLHWPEVALEGDRPWKRWGKRMLMRALLVRLMLQPIAVVRTVHNLELPDGIDAATRKLLVALDRRTDVRVVLNPSTPVPEGAASVHIPHGHYRDWFAEYPRRSRVPGRLGYFGLIRRYKGVEHLLDVYAEAATVDPGLSLHLGGRPSSVDLARAVEDAAARTPGIEATLRFLDDAEIVQIASAAELVVLPYRFMHNSGGALAALSIGTPVLLPRNQVNEALAAEVGDRWVQLFDGELETSDLRQSLAAVAGIDGTPDLSARDWEDVGRRYATVYRDAARGRRSTRRRRRPQDAAGQGIE